MSTSLFQRQLSRKKEDLLAPQKNLRRPSRILGQQKSLPFTFEIVEKKFKEEEKEEEKNKKQKANPEKPKLQNGIPQKAT